MRVICIQDGLMNLTKGKAYTVVGADQSNRVVTVYGDHRLAVRGHIDEDFIWLHEGSDKRNTESYRKMYMSLVEAIGRAGGSPSTILKDIDKMSVGELLEGLAPNGVRFYYEGPSNVGRETIATIIQDLRTGKY